MRKNSIVKGIMFILLAVIVLLLQIYPVFEISLWAIIGLVVLAGLSLNELMELDFVGAGIFTASFLTLLTYVYHPWYELVGVPYISTGVLYTFLILLGIGLDLLFKDQRRKWKRKKRWGNSYNWQSSWKENNTYYQERDGYTEAYVEAEFSTFEDEQQHKYPEDYIRADAAFGSINKYITSQNFIGGKIDCAFGDVTINLSQARLSSMGARLKVDCAFGSVKILIPKNWSVRNDMSQAMGSINDDRSGFNDSTQPQLVLKGDVVMGSVKILYV